MATKTTRSEHNQQNQEESHRKSLHRDALIFAALLGTVPFLVMGIISVVDPVHEQRGNINELVVANYEVQDAKKVKDRNYSGDDIVVTTNGKVYECIAIQMDDIVAKTPLNCDGITLQPKP